MGGLYDILQSYRQQNDPRFVYEGLFEEPAYTGPYIPGQEPPFAPRTFMDMTQRGAFGVPIQEPGITSIDLSDFIFIFGIFNFRNFLFLEFSIFGIFNFWNFGFLELTIFGNISFWNFNFLEFLIF